MKAESRERLFSITSAFDHPVTVGATILIGAVLVVAAVAVVVLSRRGRLKPELHKDLVDRIKSWLVIIPLMAGPVLLGAFATILAVCLASMLCYREFARATGLFREKLVSLLVVIGIFAINFAALDHWYHFFVALPPLTISLMAAIVIFQDRPKGYIQRVGLGIMAYMLFGVGLGHLAYLANDTLYRPLILWILVCVQMNDVFAYCVGKTIGGPKLAPNTSPNKTIAGSVGAIVLTSLLTAAIAHFIFRDSRLHHPIHLLALGLIVSIGGQLGDLTVSSIKRDIGIKDMGATFPGHGGLLDRLNSVLFVAPAVFHYIGYVRGIGLDQPTRVFAGH